MAVTLQWGVLLTRHTDFRAWEYSLIAEPVALPGSHVDALATYEWAEISLDREYTDNLSCARSMNRYGPCWGDKCPATYASVKHDPTLF